MSGSSCVRALSVEIEATQLRVMVAIEHDARVPTASRSAASGNTPYNRIPNLDAKAMERYRWSFCTPSKSTTPSYPVHRHVAE